MQAALTLNVPLVPLLLCLSAFGSTRKTVQQLACGLLMAAQYVDGSAVAALTFTIR